MMDRNRIPMKIHTLLLLIALSVVESCRRDSPPPDVLATATFAAVYVALVEEGEIHRSFGGKHGAPFNADKTLARFGISRDQVEQTIRYYNEDLERWRGLYAEVVKLQDQNEKKVTEHSP